METIDLLELLLDNCVRKMRKNSTYDYCFYYLLK